MKPKAEKWTRTTGGDGEEYYTLPVCGENMTGSLYDWYDAFETINALFGNGGLFVGVRTVKVCGEPICGYCNEWQKVMHTLRNMLCGLLGEMECKKQGIEL